MTTKTTTTARCPKCGSTTTPATKALSAPVLSLTPARPGHGGDYLRNIPPVEVRKTLMITAVCCDACEWCGSVNAAVQQ